MIKDGKEYVSINGKWITTGFKLISVKQFHYCNAKVVTLERNTFEGETPFLERMQLLVSYETAVLAFVQRINKRNDKVVRTELQFSKHVFHSRTTIRQVSRFLNDNGYNNAYHVAKKAYLNKDVRQPCEDCYIYERNIDYPAYWHFGAFNRLFFGVLYDGC